MARVTWGDPGSKRFETGLSNGVLYPDVGPGVPWNGLVSVEERSSGGENTPLYKDGVKLLEYFSNEDFEASMQVLSVPSQFSRALGEISPVPGMIVGQQRRKPFGFSYRTLVADDLFKQGMGYKLHLVYGGMVSPSAVIHTTISAENNLEPRTFEVFTVPPNSDQFKPTAHISLDSTLIDKYTLQALESKLYGTDSSDPYLPSQVEVIQILSSKITEPLSALI